MYSCVSKYLTLEKALDCWNPAVRAAMLLPKRCGCDLHKKESVRTHLYTLAPISRCAFRIRRVKLASTWTTYLATSKEACLAWLATCRTARKAMVRYSLRSTDKTSFVEREDHLNQTGYLSIWSNQLAMSQIEPTTYTTQMTHQLHP